MKKRTLFLTLGLLVVLSQALLAGAAGGEELVYEDTVAREWRDRLFLLERETLYHLAPGPVVWLGEGEQPGQTVSLGELQDLAPFSVAETVAVSREAGEDDLWRVTLLLNWQVEPQFSAGQRDRVLVSWDGDYACVPESAAGAHLDLHRREPRTAGVDVTCGGAGEGYAWFEYEAVPRSGVTGVSFLLTAPAESALFPAPTFSYYHAVQETAVLDVETVPGGAARLALEVPTFWQSRMGKSLIAAIAVPAAAAAVAVPWYVRRRAAGKEKAS